ncbi:MAG TPA: hypothetical protein VG816_09310 [Solirubrobacterales bacterium]|nr:hypothetical protein [Solirubrobacterales bacterium]
MIRLSRIFCLGLVGIVWVLGANAAQASSPLEPEGVEAGFRVRGSHGFLISAIAYSPGSSGKGVVEITASGRHAVASYRFPATVTAEALRADLGRLGEINAIRRPSGLEKTVHLKCLGGEQTYEPATYEGVIEFNGEEGYTRVKESRAAQLPAWFIYSDHGSCGSGYGESSGPGEPGARLRAISFAGGRSLSFQVNKNSRRARAVFTASIKERRDGIKIYRALSGTARAGAFRFDRLLRTAKLRLPAPFSGSALLARSRDSFSPLWTGDLRLDFPGHANVPLAGAGVHASLVHAHFTRSDTPNVKVGF